MAHELDDYEPSKDDVRRLLVAYDCSKESKAAFAKAAGIFMIYLGSCSHEFCKEDGKSVTIAPDHVLSALKELDIKDEQSGFNLHSLVAEFHDRCSSKRFHGHAV